MPDDNQCRRQRMQVRPRIDRARLGGGRLGAMGELRGWRQRRAASSMGSDIFSAQKLDQRFQEILTVGG